MTGTVDGRGSVKTEPLFHFPFSCSPSVPSLHHRAHPAPLGHVDDLPLGCTGEDREPVRARRESHHRVEWLRQQHAVGAEGRELDDRDGGEPLYHPALFVGQGRVDRPLPVGAGQGVADGDAVAAVAAVAA